MKKKKGNYWEFENMQKNYIKFKKIQFIIIQYIIFYKFLNMEYIIYCIYYINAYTINTFITCVYYI